MLPFEQLQSVISKLRFKDDTALKMIGLGKLAKAYDAYPLNEDGRKLYCLLPKGMDAQLARKLTPVAASQTIIVLQEAARGVQKVWPVQDAPAAKPRSEDGSSTVASQPVAVAQPAASEEAEPAGLGDLEFVEE